MSGGLNLWLESAFNWKLTGISTVVCKIFPFFTYTMFDYSIAIIVIMTSKKLYAVSFPLRANALKFSRKESIPALSALLICCIINSHFLFSLTLAEVISTNSFNSSTMNVCINDKWYDFYDNYWIYIDAAVYSFLPFVLITITNISIIIFLVKEKKKSLTLQRFRVTKFRKFDSAIMHSNYFTEKNNIKDSSRLQSNSLISSASKQDQLKGRMIIAEHDRKHSVFEIASRYKRFPINNKRLTIMIFLINISFSILTMPIVILQIIHQQKINDMIETIFTEKSTQTFEEKENIFNLLKAIFELLQFLNHSVNFFLYCLSGTTFRRETMIVLSKAYNRFSKCFI